MLRECGVGWTARELPGIPVSHRCLLLQKAALPLSPAAGAPRAGYRPAPRFLGCERAGKGGAEPERGAQQQGRRPGHPCPLLPLRPPPPGADPSSWGVPGFPFSAHRGGAGRPLHSRRDRPGGVVFLRWHQLLGPERPLIGRPLSVTERLSAGCSSFLSWSRGLCGLRVMCWKAPESLER